MSIDDHWPSDFQKNRISFNFKILPAYLYSAFVFSKEQRDLLAHYFMLKRGKYICFKSQVNELLMSYTKWKMSQLCIKRVMESMYLAGLETTIKKLCLKQLLRFSGPLQTPLCIHNTMDC